MSDAAQSSNATYHRNGEILEAEVGDELVALDVAAGDCFGLNEAGQNRLAPSCGPQEFRRAAGRAAHGI